MFSFLTKFSVAADIFLTVVLMLIISILFSYIAFNGEINTYPWNSINRNYIFFRSFNLGNFGETVIKEIVSTRESIFMDNKWCIKNMILLHANDASNRILMATFDVSNTFYSIAISFYGNKWCVEKDFMSTTEAWNRLIRQQMMHQNRILWQQMMHRASFYNIKQAFMKIKIQLGQGNIQCIEQPSMTTNQHMAN